MISARLTFAVYLLATAAGAMLYRTSYEVDELRGKIADLAAPDRGRAGKYPGAGCRMDLPDRAAPH